MKRFILAAVALCVWEHAPARAQFIIGVGPGQPPGHAKAAFGLKKNVGFAFGYNNFSYYGYGGFAPPVIAVPVVVVPVPAPAPVPLLPQAQPQPLPLPQREAPALPKGDFIVITPKPAGVEPEPLPLPLPLPKPKPKPKLDPLAPPPKVVMEQPEADAQKEAARLAKLARDSFAAGDYGRAAENFQRASTANPADATLYFFHAQAQFAAGQFAAAVASIREGLARDPQWPASAFDPTKLYGERPERFVLHLLALKKAVGENPNQATLEFLLGYQLWFAGDKVEANKLFRAAEKRLPAPGPIALFK